MFDGDVQVWPYVDELYSNGTAGFLEAWNDGLLLRDYQYGSSGAFLERPTRIIVMGHSHGTNWSHLWANYQSDLLIDLLIDLDGVSWAWEAPPPGFLFVGDTWGEQIAMYEVENNPPWYPDRTFSDVTESWLVDGVPYDEKDTFGENVLLNLEVWSNGSANGFPADIRDEVANQALDGTGREFARGCWFDEPHNEVDDPSSDAMSWVLGQVSEFYYDEGGVPCME